MRVFQSLQISFFIVVCCSCQKENTTSDIVIRWQSNKAVALILPAQGKENPESFSTRLSGEKEQMLGQFLIEDNDLVFKPVVPFTKGFTYEVLKDNAVLGTIEIPIGESRLPMLTGIYPSRDTVPENLLKFYFEFTEPMREGKSLNYIFLLDEKGDTLKSTFLDLTPELWNADGTLLTLWLDPGRIKRDLIPNKEMGAPLIQGKEYTLIVSQEWKSKEGAALLSASSKKFVVGSRDEKVPDMSAWVITAPKKETKQPLVITLPEPLDYSLLREAISVYAKDDLVAGMIKLGYKERVLKFFPDAPWSAGDYTIKIESRLEDLAGNNLNRPFDLDLSKEEEVSEKEFYELKFRIN